MREDDVREARENAPQKVDTLFEKGTALKNEIASLQAEVTQADAVNPLGSLK